MALDALGNPIYGNSNHHRDRSGVTSGPVTVAVHPSVTSVTIDPVTGCFSIAQTHQFVAHAFHNATEITNQIGSFTWSLHLPSVAPVDANGLATARVARHYRRRGHSWLHHFIPAVFIKSCMPVLIILHINGDPPACRLKPSIMNVTDTKTVQADMVDELGAVTPNAPVTILSNNTTVATVSGNDPDGAISRRRRSAGRMRATDVRHMESTRRFTATCSAFP